MSRIINVIKNSSVLVAIVALLCMNNSNAMRPAKNKLSLAKESFSSISFPIKKVFVRTNDGLIEQLPSWQVRQMKVLLVLLEHQQKSHNEHNPLEASMVSNQELQLLCGALNAASKGAFEDFWWKLVFADGLDETALLKTLGNGQLRMLVNAAEKVEALELSALCATYYLPALAQVSLNKVLLKDIKRSLRTIISSEKKTLGRDFTGEVCFSPQGDKLLAVGKHTVSLYDLSAEDDEEFSLDDTNGGGFCSVAFSPNGQYIFFATYEKQLCFWNRTTDKIYQFLLNDDDFDYIYKGVGFSSDGKTIMLAYSDMCRFYNVESIIETFEVNPEAIADFDVVSFNRPEHLITSMVVGLDGNQIFFGWSDAQVASYLLEEKITEFLSLSFPEESLSTLLTLSANGKSLFVARKNKISVFTVSPKDIRLIKDLSFVSDVAAMAVSPDGKSFAVASHGIWVYNKENNISLLFSLLDNSSKACNAVAFSPDGRSIAVGTDRGCIVFPCVTDAQEQVINALDYYDVAQVRLLYQLCLADMQGNFIYLSNNDRALFESFDPLIQSLFMGVVLARALEQRDEKLTIPSSGILLSSKLKAQKIRNQLQEMVGLFNKSTANKDFERARVAESSIQNVIEKNPHYGLFINKTLNKLGYGGER